MTKRLILDDFEHSDLEALYDYAREEGVGEMAGWEHHENIEMSANILERFIRGGDVYAVRLKDGTLIGSLGVHRVSYKEFLGKSIRELGYVLKKSEWNKGYMTEAVKAVCDHLLKEKGIEVIIIQSGDGNIASRKIAEKCGFVEFKICPAHPKLSLLSGYKKSVFYKKERKI